MVLGKLIREVEDKIGLPKLAEVAEVLKSLDERKLRIVKAVLNDVSKIKGSPEELAMVVALVKYITDADMEHLNAVRDITANLVKVVKYLPKDAIKELPLKEIAQEVKKAMGG